MSYILMISKDTQPNLNILNKRKYFIPIKTKIVIYSSLVLSHLNFGILAWGFQCARLTKLLKKIIRILSRSKYNACTERIFKELKLLKLEDTIKLQELKLYYKYKNNKLPCYCKICHLNQTQKPMIMQHVYNITYTNLRLTMFMQKYCACFDVPSVINSSPKAILDKIDTNILQGFIRYIKNYILPSYQELCIVVNCYICGVPV